MPIETNREAAETLALKALAYLVNSPDELDRFLATSGVNVHTLRRSAGEPELLAAVMDFLLSQEVLLTRFCEYESLDSKTIHLARRALPGA